MNLTNPTIKMSKSAPKDDKGTIFILDDVEITKKKIMSACTDNEGKIYFDEENKPGISNLLSIVAAIDNLSLEEVSEKYQEYNYKDFKIEVANKVSEFIINIQNKFYKYRNDEEYLIKILQDGAEKAKVLANLKMKEVKQKIGLRLY